MIGDEIRKRLELMVALRPERPERLERLAMQHELEQLAPKS